MIWYIENPQRFRQEREALDQLASTSDWLAPGDWRIDASLRLNWDVDIVVAGQARPATLRYPNHFPDSPAFVLPRDPDARWSGHQYGVGGELCLEFGPDNWHPQVTGADLIRSAYRLLKGEDSATASDRTIVASRHSTTLGQTLRQERWRLLITRNLVDALASIPDKAIVIGKLVTMFHKESMVHAISSLKLTSGGEWVDPSVPKALKFEAYEPAVMLTRWPADIELPTTTSASELRTAIGATDEATAKIANLVIVRGETLYGRWLSDDDSINDSAIVPAQQQHARIDSDHLPLALKKVAIVGCGSLGSKIGVMLARAGVGKFLLVDDDVMLPDNLVRHELDWREVGTHKADAVARGIDLVNPAAECHVRRHRLGGQESSGSIETLISSLSMCDLIIDATADARAFGYIAAAASAGKKAMMWVEVFGGGFGGLIARHRPSLEPDPASMRSGIEDWCRQQGKPIEHAVDYERRGSGPPSIADDADVTVIAAHAARLAIDTLIGRDPSMFPSSVYMIGLAEGWIFDQPFDTRPISFDKPAVDPAPPVDQQLVDEEMARVRQLYEKFANANTTAPADSPPPAS